jgi:vacuolar-type H+-ATPase subunit E/Vma4
MSLTAILGAIEREATAEAEATIGAARDQAARLVTDARTTADARVAEAVAVAEPAFAAEAVRIVNAARLRLLRRRAELGTAAFEAAWHEAGQRLGRLVATNDERWSAGLRAVTAEALEMVGSGASVTVPTGEAALVAALVAAHGGTLVTVDGDAPPGPLVRSRDGRIEVDATLPARLDRARVSLAGDVAAALGAES